MALQGTILTVEEIVNRYLYNIPTTPANKVDAGLIRDTAALGNPISIDVDDYMEEVGRFALGSMSALVQKFFSYIGDIPGMVAGQEYTKSDIAALLNLDEYRISFQHYAYDDGKGDYADRTFIWNSSIFKLGDQVRFVVEQNANGITVTLHSIGLR
jgi:hypothetical protein